MSLKQLFGLEESDWTDRSIMAKVKDAMDKGLMEVEFEKLDGTKVVVNLPQMSFSKYIDPWDGSNKVGAA